MSIYRTLNRRRFVASAVGLATTLQLERAARALGLSQPAGICTLMPEQEVGPYYVAEEALRSNIREEKTGVPLSLRLLLLDARSCKPLEHAAIDLWHCDALGIYSGYTKSSGPGGPGGPPPDFDPQEGPPPGPPPDFDENGGRPPHPPGGPGGPGGPMAPKPTDNLTFLRGIQITGADGGAHFTTIFPGVYPGRTNHIHFKVRLDGKTAPHGKGTTYEEGHTSHIGQVFFEESLCVELMKSAPYAEHRIHRTTQAEDDVFNGQHGAASIARVTLAKPGNAAAGLTAELVVAVDPTATPAPAERGRGGPPPRRQSSPAD